MAACELACKPGLLSAPVHQGTQHELLARQSTHLFQEHVQVNTAPAQCFTQIINNVFNCRLFSESSQQLLVKWRRRSHCFINVDLIIKRQFAQPLETHLH